MPSKSLINPHAPSFAPRMVGRHSDKVSQPLSESEKQLCRAREKRARRGAVRLEAAERGQIERAPSCYMEDDEPAIGELPDGPIVLRCEDYQRYTELGLQDIYAEAETSHQGPDQ